MRRTTIISLAAFATTTATTPIAAQVRMTQGSNRPISIAFGGGASVPIGTYKDALKAGWNGQGSVIFNFAGFPLALRANLNYNKFTFKNDLPFSGGGSAGTITTTNDITQQISTRLHNGVGRPGLAGFNIKTISETRYRGQRIRAKRSSR